MVAAFTLREGETLIWQAIARHKPGAAKAGACPSFMFATRPAFGDRRGAASLILCGEVITALMVTLSSFLLLVVRRSRWDILVREKKPLTFHLKSESLINLDRFPA